MQYLFFIFPECFILNTSLVLEGGRSCSYVLARTHSELKGHTAQGRGGWSEVCRGFFVILTMRSHDPQYQLAVDALGQSTEFPIDNYFKSCWSFACFVDEILAFASVASTLFWFWSLHVLLHVLCLLSSPFPSICPADLASWGSGLVTSSECHCVVSQRRVVSWHWILAAQLPSNDL